MSEELEYRVRKIIAGKNEDRVIYQWDNGMRLKIDKQGFALYHGDELLYDCGVYCHD